MTKLFHLAAAAGSVISLGLAVPVLAQQAAPPASQTQSQTQTQAPPPSSAAPAQQSAPASDAGQAPTPAPAVPAASAPTDQPAGATPAAPPAPVVPAAPAVPSKIELPTGTHIPLVLHNAVSTRSAQPGDPVYFETSFPVMLNGKVVVPAGSWVSGEVTETKRPGRVKGRAELMVRL